MVTWSRRESGFTHAISTGRRVWTPCFQGRDIPSDWFSLLLKIATIEDIGFFGTEGMFEVPR